MMNRPHSRRCFRPAVGGAIALLLTGVPALVEAAPGTLHHQGRVVARGVNFDGTGLFKFAFVDPLTGDTRWSNDGSSTAGREPGRPVLIDVEEGHYSVVLGDTAVPGMTAIPTEIFAGGDVRLRIWFDDGVSGSQLLTPDRPVVPVAMAHVAASATSLPPGTVSGAEILDGSVRGVDIGAGAVTGAHIATGAVSSSDIANGSLRLLDMDLSDVDTRYEKAGATKLVVDAAGGGDFTRIGDAVDAVAPSAGNPVTIEVRPGTYVETVKLKSYVHLRGAGDGHTVVQAPGDSSATAAAIVASGIVGAHVSELTVSERPGGTMDPGILVDAGSLDVVDCGFETFNNGFSSRPAAVRAVQDATVRVEGCRFASMQDETAIVIELNSTGVICDNRFEGGGPWFGIRVVAGSRALVARNEFKHLDHAILLENQGGASEALVTGNHFLRVAVGLNVAGGCTATFTGNALDAEGDGSTRGVVSEGSATVAGNVFRRIEIALLLDGANATVTGNTFDQCGAGGIDAVHINTAPAVVSGNAFFGSTAADISSPGDVSIFSANGVSVSLVGDEAVEVSPKLQTGMLEADTVGVATSGAPALVPLHVSGKAMFGDAFSPTTSHTQAALNLLAGQGATAPANGIKFYEFGTGDFGMSLGYDGTATGVNNALRIYDNGGDPVLSFENGGHVGLGVTNPTNPIEHSSGATLTVGGTWSDASSVTLKENFRPVDPDGVLGRLAALPVTRWSYKAEPGIDHIGPMAEDFHAAFGLGPDDRTISGTDRSGVAFAAIKALHEKLEAKERRVQELERRLEAIERKLEPAR